VISGLFHPGCTVSSLDQALRFYGERLGIEHARGQVSDQPYLALVTGLPGCSLKLGFARIEGDDVPLELIECVNLPAGRSGAGFGIVGTAHQCYQVDDLAGAYDRLTRAGVSCLTEPHPLGDGPWADAHGAFLRDPDGFLIELIEEQPASRNGHGRLVHTHHFGLTVSDLDAVLSFLCQQLQLTETSRYACDSAYLRHSSRLKDGQMRAATVSIPGTQVAIELWEFRSAVGAPARVATNSIGSGHLCFLVDDIMSIHSSLSSRGVRFVGPPAEVTAGVNKGAYAIYFWGPDDLRFELFQKPALPST
jgi:catechol 2,3-dioxygenase-like lactoylglutathione lyase family enzyme